VAEGVGAEIAIYRLYELNFRGCTACLACKRTSEECVLKDDLAPVLRAVRQADGLILASPIYFGQITGELKSFIDRMYSMLAPGYLSSSDRSRLSPGRKCGFITTQGNPSPEVFANVFPTYEGFLGPEWMGYETRAIRGLGLGDPTAAAASDELMSQARAMGEWLVS
jgi:multimeric flavodoxin WrbA